MNPIQDLVANFQSLVGQVPELVQPFVVMLAATIPFIEGEGAAPIGVIGGIPPIVAGIAAAIGNFVAVLVVVLVSSRARVAVVARVGAGGVPVDETVETVGTGKPESKGRQRFKRWLVRFGVPGASLLAPLAIPSHFTAAMLVAAGIPRARVLLWQAIAIVAWTILTTTLVWLAVSALLG